MFAIAKRDRIIVVGELLSPAHGFRGPLPSFALRTTRPRHACRRKALTQFRSTPQSAFPYPVRLDSKTVTTVNVSEVDRGVHVQLQTIPVTWLNRCSTLTHYWNRSGAGDILRFSMHGGAKPATQRGLLPLCSYTLHLRILDKVGRPLPAVVQADCVWRWRRRLYRIAPRSRVRTPLSTVRYAPV